MVNDETVLVIPSDDWGSYQQILKGSPKSRVISWDLLVLWMARDGKLDFTRLPLMADTIPHEIVSITGFTESDTSWIRTRVIGHGGRVLEKVESETTILISSGDSNECVRSARVRGIPVVNLGWVHNLHNPIPLYEDSGGFKSGGTREGGVSTKIDLDAPHHLLSVAAPSFSCSQIALSSNLGISSSSMAATLPLPSQDFYPPLHASKGSAGFLTDSSTIYLSALESPPRPVNHETELENSDDMAYHVADLSHLFAKKTAPTVPATPTTLVSYATQSRPLERG